jgi:hypothetical protein
MRKKLFLFGLIFSCLYTNTHVLSQYSIASGGGTQIDIYESNHKKYLGFSFSFIKDAKIPLELIVSFDYHYVPLEKYKNQKLDKDAGHLLSATANKAINISNFYLMGGISVGYLYFDENFHQYIGLVFQPGYKLSDSFSVFIKTMGYYNFGKSNIELLLMSRVGFEYELGFLNRRKR